MCSDQEKIVEEAKENETGLWLNQLGLDTQETH